jgi:hypothetical protein
MGTKSDQTARTNLTGSLNALTPAFDYMLDAAQRTILFWDVMRQRGNAYREHLAETAPHVLDYQVELVVDGRKLDRPVNYGLVRIIPPKEIDVDPKPDTRAISSGSCLTRCLVRPLRTLRAPKQSFLKRSLLYTRKPMKSRA